MSYTKKTWKTGDTITAAALNNLEQGASDNAEAIADIEAALPTYVGEKVTRKAAATITPGTADQTIAANQYLTGTQTIKGDANLAAGNIKKGTAIFGVTGTLEAGSTGTDTSDATAEAADIVSGKTAYVASGKVTGTLGSAARLMYAPNTSGDEDATVSETSYTPAVGSGLKKIRVKAPSVTSVSGKKVIDASSVELDIEISPSAFGNAVAANVLSGKTFTASPGLKVSGTMASKAAATITPGTADQTIASGQYLSGAQTIKGDANLVAANIKKGVSIFGVTGTLESGGGSGVVVKTGTFTGNGGAVEVDTGLSSVSYFIAYDSTKAIHAQGLVVAIMDSAHSVSGLGVSCSSYSQYIKNFSVSTSGILTISGGKVSFPGTSTTNAPISNATYNWVAVGEA